MKRLIYAVVLFSIAGIFLTLSLRAYWAVTDFMRGTVSAEAEVVEFATVVTWETSRERKTGIVPVFEFRDKTGKIFRGQSGTAISPNPYEVGQKIRILYHPENPNDVRIVSFLTLWSSPVFLGGIGGVFFLLGLLQLFLLLRKQKKINILKPSVSDIMLPEKRS